VGTSRYPGSSGKNKQKNCLDKLSRNLMRWTCCKSSFRRSILHITSHLVMNFFREFAGYRAIPGDKERQDATTARSSMRRGMLLGVAGLSVFVLGVMVGAGTGSRSPSGSACVETLRQPSSLAAPPIDLSFSVIEKPFKYNRTFGEDPFHNQATMDAWEDIVPGRFSPLSLVQLATTTFQALRRLG
jgi:hypothetical protein